MWKWGSLSVSVTNRANSDPHQKIRVLLACPKGARTGGPESIHQLCDALRSRGVSASLINFGPDVETVSEYEIYDAPWACVADLEDATHLIVPEIFLAIPNDWVELFKGKFVVWWLSIDNSTHSKARSQSRLNRKVHRSWLLPNGTLPQVLIAIAGSFVRVLRESRSKLADGRTDIDLGNADHLAQSEYASTWLEQELGIHSDPMTDYILRLPVATEGSVTNQDQRPLIVYNPAKGGAYVKKLERLLSATFRLEALERMSRLEMRRKLSSASLYIDLGHFPGRDRIPREAIVHGCPVLISTQGAGGNANDFPLDPKFKINLMLETPKTVAKIVREYAPSKSLLVGEQEEFLAFVDSDLTQFEKQVNDLLVRLELRKK